MASNPSVPGRWLGETDHPDSRLTLRAAEIIHENRTEHQHLVLFENPTLGRVLMLDGVFQTSERDEFIYHEMMAHLPILAHGDAKRVLIVGGGDGGLLEEVLKHRGVEAVTMVEIDSSVVGFAKRYLRRICGQAFEDPRLELVIADGFEFVAACPGAYDAILVDSTDPIGPGEILFSEEFYRRCRGALAPGGLMVRQCGIPFYYPEILRDAQRDLWAVFGDAAAFTATIPIYGGQMAIGFASDDPAKRLVPLETLRDRFAASGLKTGYYTPGVHGGAFALPRFMQSLVDQD